MTFQTGDIPGTIKTTEISIIDDTDAEGSLAENFFVRGDVSADNVQFFESDTVQVDIIDNDGKSEKLHVRIVSEMLAFVLHYHRAVL